MLDNVKDDVQKMLNSSESFNSYYNQFMMSVQDQNIDFEIHKYLHGGASDISRIDRQIELAYRELVK